MRQTKEKFLIYDFIYEAFLHYQLLFFLLGKTYFLGYNLCFILTKKIRLVVTTTLSQAYSVLYKLI